MGYTAQPFAVDLELVKSVLGSKDTELLEKAKLADLYDCYASQAEEDGHDFDEILEDLIVRYIKPGDRQNAKSISKVFRKKTESGLNPKLEYLYGYALLVICDTLGTYLSPQGDVFYAGRVWKKANELLKDNGITIDLDRMWNTEKLFDIPDIEDFPVISHYSKNEIDYLLNELHKMDILQEESIKPDESDVFDEWDELQELLTTFRNGLQVCKDKNVEWISFLH